MVALQIRDVPDDVRDALAAKARDRGQSLQAFLLELVEREADRLSNRELLQQFDGRSDGTRVTFEEAAEAIHAARREAGRE